MILYEDYIAVMGEATRLLCVNFQKQAKTIHPLYATLLTDLETLTLRGGKRFRPYLAYLAYQGSGGKNEEAFLQVAAGLELFHTFLLIHDDIIDRDVLRYGGLNIGGKYREKIQGKDADHFADMAALLAGDTASTLSRLAIHNSGFSPVLRAAVLAEFDTALFSVCGGEFVDSLATVLTTQPLTEKEILTVYTHKTALYSFDLPLRVGLILAGANPKTLATRQFSIPLGQAYQLHDDYLGIFGDSKQTGKSVLSDIREGKQTYLYATLVARATPEQQELLSTHYGNPRATGKSVEVIRQLAVATGALEAVEQRIKALTLQARKALKTLGLNAEATAALEELIKLALERIA